MAESDAPVNPNDLSPSLGGERAPEPETEQAEAGPSLGPEFSELFGADTTAELESLVQTFGLFGQTLQSLVSETMQVIETRLPQTLAAFEGLLDAVNQAFEEPPTTAGTPDVQAAQETTESQDQDA